MSDETIRYRFKGGDPPTAWYADVPARDLTDDDWAGLTPRQRADVEKGTRPDGSPLYERVPAPKRDTPAKAAREAKKAPARQPRTPPEPEDVPEPPDRPEAPEAPAEPPTAAGGEE